jgi:hypothetical protein
VYVYQSTGEYTGSYSSYVNGVGSARFIASGQGFFVRTSSMTTPGTLKFTNAARATTYTNPTFQRPTTEDRTLVQLKLTGSTQQKDAAYVYFEQGATPGFDKAYDAYKLPASGQPYLAISTLREPLSISGLPLLTATDVVVALDVQVPTTGTYSLEAAQLLNLPAGVHAYLSDAQTGTRVDLTRQASYTFSMNQAFQGPRFSLLFTSSQVLAQVPASLKQQVLLYPNPAQGMVLLELPASFQHHPVTMTLVNALGQTVRHKDLAEGELTHSVSLIDLRAGVYSLRLHSVLGSVTKRLVIE